MKLIAISLSSECIKQPRCSFCYQNKEKISYDWFRLSNVRDLIRAFPGATVSFEYNGYNLGTILSQHYHWIEGAKIKTITTMPQVISKTFCGAVAAHGISAIALSYDSEKVSRVEAWVEKAKMIKQAGMKVSCNFLLESTTKIPVIPREVLQTADQVNILALKPTGKIENTTGVEVLIEYCKNFLPVAVDNCLGYQLGYTDYCGAGREFCHVRPDGRVMDCCFQTDCFLWLNKNSRRIAEMAFSENEYHPGSYDIQTYLHDWLGMKIERR